MGLLMSAVGCPLNRLTRGHLLLNLFCFSLSPFLSKDSMVLKRTLTKRIYGVLQGFLLLYRSLASQISICINMMHAYKASYASN